MTFVDLELSDPQKIKRNCLRLGLLILIIAELKISSEAIDIFGLQVGISQEKILKIMRLSLIIMIGALILSTLERSAVKRRTRNTKEVEGKISAEVHDHERQSAAAQDAYDRDEYVHSREFIEDQFTHKSKYLKRLAWTNRRDIYIETATRDLRQSGFTYLICYLAIWKDDTLGRALELIW